MRKLLVLLFFFATATTAFAHAGHVHTYMGTVTAVRGSSAFTMKTTNGRDVTVQTSPTTKWQRADGGAANPADLAAGKRVVVKMMLDDKTAASVKMAR